MSGTVQCPFDPSHQVTPNRFGKHLTKCRRQHPNVKYERCPLNSFHYVKPEDLKEHVRTCPSRMELEAYKYSVSSTLAAPSEELIINTGDQAAAGSSVGAASLLRDAECWDDSNYEAYNPFGKCKLQKEQNRHFIQPCANKFVVANVSAAKRKEEFHHDAEEEGQAVKEEDDLSDDDRSANRSAVVVKEETPAREPKEKPPAREPYGGRTYDARDRRSADHKPQHYEWRERNSEGESDSSSSNGRYQRKSYGDRYMDGDGRKRDGHSSSRSHGEYRDRYTPYQNPYSQNVGQSRDQKVEASNMYFKDDRHKRQD